jgi:hypothetical protein
MVGAASDGTSGGRNGGRAVRCRMREVAFKCRADAAMSP